MNLVVKLNVALAAALILNGAAWASDVRHPADDAATASPDATASQPYATIVARNIFGLVPVPPPAPPDLPPADPPPKITPNGIMSIFGQLQALFKVAVPPKDGQPAKDHSYMLSEGQRQDDIEVTKIDEKAATITFNNHGTIQELPLVVGQASSSGAPPAAGGPGAAGIPGFPRFRNRPGGFPGQPPGGFGGGFPGRPSSPAQNGNPVGMNNNEVNANNAAAGLNFNNPVAAQTASSTDTQTLTREEQEVLIEAERARLQSSPKPEYPPGLLPPTSLTPP